MQFKNQVLIGALIICGIWYVKNNEFSPNIDPGGLIDGKGLRVMIVEETAERTKLPKEQVAIFGSEEVRALLNEKCTKEKEGNHPAWWIFDDDSSLENIPKSWQKAFEKRYQPPPSVMVSNGRKGFSGPLPKDVENFKTLINKYVK